MQTLTIPKAIYIYDEGIKHLDFKEIRKFIKRNFGGIKVHLVKSKKKITHVKGLLLDFVSTQRAFGNLKAKGACHIILTDKLFSTLGEDNRPHIRASIYSEPSIISIPGIVEGPAKPKEFYMYKKRYEALGVWDLKEPEVKKRFKERFIDYGDKRIPEVLKGYISQAVFFYITGEPFCDKKSCRLYNAHWQKDLLYSQIKQGRFCKYHNNLLAKIMEMSKAK